MLVDYVAGNTHGLCAQHSSSCVAVTIQNPTRGVWQYKQQPSRSATYQHRSASPRFLRASSSRHKFHLALFISTRGLMLGWPVKSARTLTTTLVVLLLVPQSAQHGTVVGLRSVVTCMKTHPCMAGLYVVKRVMHACCK